MKYEPLPIIENHTCNGCHLAADASTVKVSPRYGDGDIYILLVGEAPGKDEDKEGRAFVGASGIQLNTLLTEAGIPPRHVGITNLVRCIPWRNKVYRDAVRQPNEDEIFSCLDYLHDEILHINPRVVVTLGSLASRYLAGVKTTLTKERGTVFRVNFGSTTVKVIPTFHPASILHGNVKAREEIIRDLRKAWAISQGREEYTKPDWEVAIDTYRAIEIVNSATDAFERKECDYIAYDTETIFNDPFNGKDKLLGFSLAWSTTKGYFIPLYHKESRIDIPKLRPHLERLFHVGKFTGHNIKYDFIWTYMSLGMEFSIIFDTYLASVLVFGETRQHNLKDLARDFLNYPEYDTPIQRMLDSMKFKKDRHYGNIPLQTLGEYACLDAVASYALAGILKLKIEELDVNTPMELLLQATYVFAEIELNGWRIDIDRLHKIEEYYVERRDHYYKELLRSMGARWLIGRGDLSEPISLMFRRGYPDNLDKEGMNLMKMVFKPNSPKMKSIIFDFYRAPIFDRSEHTGDPSTNEKSLVGICQFFRNTPEEKQTPESRDAAKFVENLWVCRKISKVLSSYIKKIPTHIRNGSDVISFTYNLHGTRTGRFSTSDYAIHTTPRKSDIKRCFISSNREFGGIILDCDYSQWEMRIFALEANEYGMIEAFEKGHDIYLYIGSVLFEKPMEMIQDIERQISKKTVLGIIYGEGAKGIAENAGIPVDQAYKVLDMFFQKFKGAKKYVDRISREVKATGMVRSRLGRIRHFPGALDNMEEWRRAEIQRQAQNFPIQSVASDLTLIALLNAYAKMERKKLRSRILGFIHDGIPSDIYPGELFDVLCIFKQSMGDDLKRILPWLSIPIKSEFEIGASWGGTIKIVDWSGKTLKLNGNLQFFNELVEVLRKGYQFEITNYKEVLAEEEKEYEFRVDGVYLGYGGGNMRMSADLVFDDVTRHGPDNP